MCVMMLGFLEVVRLLFILQVETRDSLPSKLHRLAYSSSFEDIAELLCKLTALALKT